MAWLACLILWLPSDTALAGALLPTGSYDAGVIPVDVQTGDFNKDGIVDLVVVSQGQASAGLDPAQVRAFLGYGDGSFKPCAPFNLTGSGNRLFVADLNGDGKSDLVVRMFDTDAHVLLSQGDGTFVAAPDLEGTNVNARVGRPPAEPRNE
jgi:hypothetical protein